MHGLLRHLGPQSQASSLGQRGDKTQWILVISTFSELRSYVTANWGEIQKSGSEMLWTMSHTVKITRQLCAPHQNRGRGRGRKVQFSQLQKVNDLDLDL